VVDVEPGELLDRVDEQRRAALEEGRVELALGAGTTSPVSGLTCDGI
jgi:hypothetical protein